MGWGRKRISSVWTATMTYCSTTNVIEPLLNPITTSIVLHEHNYDHSLAPRKVGRLSFCILWNWLLTFSVSLTPRTVSSSFLHSDAIHCVRLSNTPIPSGMQPNTLPTFPFFNSISTRQSGNGWYPTNTNTAGNTQAQQYHPLTGITLECCNYNDRLSWLLWLCIRLLL